MRLRLIGKRKDERHDVWPTEINVKLRGRRRRDILDKIPKKLLEKLEEVEA